MIRYDRYDPTPTCREPFAPFVVKVSPFGRCSSCKNRRKRMIDGSDSYKKVPSFCFVYDFKPSKCRQFSD
jgi:hypothetical protein